MARNCCSSASSTIPAPEPRPVRPVESAADASRVAQLEQELEATREDLQSAIRDLEIANEEQKAINEEAMSVNEEFQSTNEELETSKEELQSLNEELTALNSQLHETVEQQRATSNDLQNILNSTDVATLFLDADLNIRFFTPAAKSLFNVIASDVGRPLADLTRRFEDDDLLPDARAVLASHAPVRREVKADDGGWFMRGMLPYRSDDSSVEGVVITFAGISEIKGCRTRDRGRARLSRQHHRHHSPAAGRPGRGAARHLRVELVPSHLFGQARGPHRATPPGRGRSSRCARAPRIPGLDPGPRHHHQ